MNKPLLFLLCAVFISPAMQAKDFMLWTSFSVKNNVNKWLTSTYNQHMWYRDNIKNFWYMQFEPAFLMKYSESSSFGIELRAAYFKNESNQWIFEHRPTLVFHHKVIRADKFTLTSRVRLYGRVLGARGNWGAFRLRLGLSFFKNKYGSVSSSVEFNYNNNNFQQIDRVRVIVGPKWRMGNNFSLGTYYLHEDNKLTVGGGWRGFHALYFALNASY